MQQFVDEVSLVVSSGSGGAGAISFRREKYVPRGGPDGGDGGRGGDLIVESRRDLRTLLPLTQTRTIRAENGHPGRYRNRHGRDGSNAVMAVPPGTIIYDEGTGQAVWDGVRDPAPFTLLRGGRGGKGNAHFATSRHQAPRFAQDGEPGTELRLRLELRLIADVGLVGMPNAGKSSLLGRLTAAHPKIGAYPFTTKTPNLGVLELDDQQLVLADIPGLIKGASTGAGLGHQFLRHISRTRLLAFVLDISEPEPLSTLATLMGELRDYSDELAMRRRIIIANKIDLPGSAESLAELHSGLESDRVYPVSAIRGDNLRPLAGGLLQLVNEGQE